MSIINRSIPQFTVQAFHNGEFKTVTDQDVRGKWSIFIFYPADFTFVCPTELEDMAKHYDEFQKLGAEVYSVSCDTHFVHKAWHDTSDAIGKINYPMLADPVGVLARGFDVMIEDAGIALRGTFLASCRASNALPWSAPFRAGITSSTAAYCSPTSKMPPNCWNKTASPVSTSCSTTR